MGGKFGIVGQKVGIIMPVPNLGSLLAESSMVIVRSGL